MKIMWETVNQALKTLEGSQPDPSRVTELQNQYQEMVDSLTLMYYSEAKRKKPPQTAEEETQLKNLAQELAYGEVLESEINDPIRMMKIRQEEELGELLRAGDWETYALKEIEFMDEDEISQTGKTKAQLITEALNPEPMSKEERDKLRLKVWLSNQKSDPGLEDEQYLNQTTERLWKQIQEDPSSDPRLNERASR